MTSSLHVITDRDRRGAQVHAMDLAAGLRARGREVEVVALAPGNHGDLLEVDALGRRRRGPTALRALRRRGADFDVVVAHGSATLAACAIAFAGTKTKFIYRQISDPRFWASSISRRSRVAALIRRADRVVALSNGVAEVFAAHYGLGAGRIVTIPNAVPAELWTPATEQRRAESRLRYGVADDEVVMLYLGALVPEKGVDRAIRACARVERLALLVVGDGPQREELEWLAADCHGRVRFTGPLNDPRPALDAADLLVLSSRGGDSMPAVLIESGLCGLPAVTTPVGAIEDVVVDGLTGRVVPIDDAAALLDALRSLVQDPAERRRLGEAARARCSSMFTIDAVAPRWEQLFESVQGHGGAVL